MFWQALGCVCGCTKSHPLWIFISALPASFLQLFLKKSQNRTKTKRRTNLTVISFKVSHSAVKWQWEAAFRITEHMAAPQHSRLLM